MTEPKTLDLDAIALEYHKSKKNTLEECKNAILKVADVFRCNDIHLEGLSIEERTFLNDIGHILDWLSANLITYKYADDEKKREMRQEMHVIRHEIEDRKRPEHIGVPGGAGSKWEDVL